MCEGNVDVVEIPGALVGMLGDFLRFGGNL